jgi:ribosomal protein L32
MGKPKKQTTGRRTGTRRSHLVLKLARQVNATSPVKAYTTKREAGKALTAEVRGKVLKPFVSKAKDKKATDEKKAAKKAAK